MMVRQTFSLILWDLFILFAAFILLTGGSLWIHGPIKSLIQQKPWLHRLVIAFIMAAALLGTAWRDYRYQLGKGARSGLEKFVFSLKIPGTVLLWTLFLCLAVIGTAGAWVRHEYFQSSFDLAIFVQAIWNTTQGNFLHSSIKGGINLLGDHFSPFLAILAIPYAFWSDPKCLLFFQAVAWAASIFPIFRLAYEHSGSEKIGLVFAIAYALYLPARNAVRFDFHPEVFAMLPLLWAFFFIKEGKRGWASILLALSISMKENVALITFTMGFYSFFFEKARRFGSFWMICSAVYFSFVISIAIPYFSGHEYFYLQGNFAEWQQQGWGAFRDHLLNFSTVAYMVKIFAPVGFFSFLHPPTFLLTLPMLMQNLIARNEMVRSIFFHYTVLLTPFVFISAIYGGALLLKRRFFLYYFLACAFLMSGVSEYYIIQAMRKEPPGDFSEVKRQFKLIPERASVRTNEFLAPHLAHRKELHIYENTHPREGGRLGAHQADYVILAKWIVNLQMPELLKVMEKTGHILYLETPDIWIFKHNH